MKVVKLLLLTLLLAGCSLGTESEPEAQPTSKWGGPYTARTWVGKDLLHVEATWVDGELKIPDLPLPYGISFSIEFDPETYEWSEECMFHPDPLKNTQGDLNSIVESPFEFENPGYGALLIPPGVEDCAFRQVTE